MSNHEKRRRRTMLYFRQKGLCCYCNVFMENVYVGDPRYPMPNEATLEHLVPLTLGGTDKWDNLACCCRRCNVKRGHKLAKKLNQKERKQHG